MDLHDHIATLAAQKPFAALTPDEQALVRAHHSQAEYEQLHRALRSLRTPSGGPDPDIRARLMAHIRPRHEAWWQRRITLPQAAAACLIVASMAFWLRPTAPAPRIVTATIIRTDTLWRTKTDTLWRTRTVLRQVPAAPPVALPPSPILAAVAPFELPDTQPKLGLSLEQQPELLDFLGEK